MGIRNIVKWIFFREKRSSVSYVEYLKKRGVNIKASCWIVSPKHVSIDLTRPYLINIGENVTITQGVTILSHGFDWSVLKGKYNQVLGSAGKVIIGNNVFIGANATILKGVTIGNNVIIGANSLVNKDIQDDCVAAGNPCKMIYSLGEYFEKRLKCQYIEAKNMAIEYYEKHGEWPKEDELDEFFWLFQSRDDVIKNEKFRRKMEFGGNIIETTNKYKKTLPEFSDYEQFIKSIEESFSG